jgi:hypothetical protein
MYRLHEPEGMMADDDELDDDGPVTEAELEEAKRRWDESGAEPSVTELFRRSVTGNGIRGDVLIGEESPEEETDTGDAARS